MSPYQTLIGQKTKKKIPIFQGRKDENQNSTIIKNINGNPHLNFGINISDFNYDYQNHQLSIIVKKKKFIPINVYKGLVKIALSLCSSEELESYKKTISWLCEKEHNTNSIIYDIPLLLIRTRYSTKYNPKPSALLFKRKVSISENIYRPKLCLIVYSGILVFQIFIPFCKETETISKNEYKFQYDIFPAFIFDVSFPKDQEKIQLDLSNLDIAKYDMNYNQHVEENELIMFKYDNIVRNG